MKRCQKEDEPSSLQTFRAARPTATWEQMRNDPHDGGMTAYADIKASLLRSQCGLCAYCEMDLGNALSLQRVEHYHSKNDSTDQKNWALEWGNLWLVCLGGSGRPAGDVPPDPRHCLEPLEINLSCDAFKDRQINQGHLPVAHEGILLSPHEIPAFPRLFKFSPEGGIEPDDTACANVIIASNRTVNTLDLTQSTIAHLNLNCPRLTENRRIAKAQLEKRMQVARQSGKSIADIVRGLLHDGVAGRWREFFTLIRWRIGQPAEEHLTAINFNG